MCSLLCCFIWLSFSLSLFLAHVNEKLWNVTLLGDAWAPTSHQYTRICSSGCSCRSGKCLCSPTKSQLYTCFSTSSIWFARSFGAHKKPTPQPSEIRSKQNRNVQELYLNREKTKVQVKRRRKFNRRQLYSNIFVLFIFIKLISIEKFL